jgi:hypothetical protein
MQTPSQSLIIEAQQAQTITDSTGRRLSLRRLNALDRLRLFKAAGPALAQNPLWLGMATLAVSVTALDDVPIPPPVTEAQIETLVSRLGDAGLAAIAHALSPAFPAAKDTMAGN